MQTKPIRLLPRHGPVHYTGEPVVVHTLSVGDKVYVNAGGRLTRVLLTRCEGNRCTGRVQPAVEDMSETIEFDVEAIYVVQKQD